MKPRLASNLRLSYLSFTSAGIIDVYIMSSRNLCVCVVLGFEFRVYDC
jgi:hypothetical protein